MVEFFLSIEAFDRFADNHLWKKILSAQDQVFLDIDRSSLDSLLEKEGSNIFELQKQIDVSFVAAKNDIKDMMRGDRSLLYRHPFGIFVLDVPISEAEKIQKETGVFCMSNQEFLKIVKAEPIILDVPSTEAEKLQKETGVFCISKQDFSAEPISLGGLTYRRSLQCQKGTGGYSWKTFLTRIKQIPSNCIVINDRYLFGSNQESLSLGAFNIVNILNEILPKKLIFGEYHVLIIYDITANSNLDIIERIASEIHDNIKRIREQLDLRLEIVGAKNDFTHNRLIATNYGIFSADHKLAAFDRKSCACADQSILYKGLFSEGLTRDDESDFPIETQNLFLNRMREVIDNATGIYWVKHKKFSGLTSAQAIENRLIRYL